MAFRIWSKAKMYLLAAVCFVVVPMPLARCQSAAISPALHNRDVVELVRTGISTEMVIAEINSSETDFDTSEASLEALKQANIREPVIAAMVESSARKGAFAPAAVLSYEESGHVKIYRSWSVLGFTLVNSIFVDDVKVVNMTNGSHCSIRLRPGMHKIRADETSSPVYLDVQKGKEYYIRVDERSYLRVIPPSPLEDGHGRLTLLQSEQGSGKYERERPVEWDRRLAKEMLDAESEPSQKSLSPDEFGHVKVYRTRDLVGSVLAPVWMDLVLAHSIWVDNVEVASVGSGRRCSIRLPPGTYEIRSDDKSSMITLSVERGQEYYIRVDEESGLLKGHGKLTLVSSERGSGEYGTELPMEDDRRLAKDILDADSEPSVQKSEPKR